MSPKNNEGIIDRLVTKGDKDFKQEDVAEIETIVPQRCLLCKSNVICSLIPSFIQMGKAGLVIIVDKCPYHTELQ